ncbi:MAG: ABC transporter ATP-binding protein [Deltaproteobacteria bacterium]|nr:ABC transporter ATP-binding protein [Deltaproteobacteria bacterium]MBW2418132.1 ABC transporter ATP-binding protein [Deltaproteobacteria bacterium]
MPPSQPIVELREVSKRFGDREAVCAVDLVVFEGECFGLLGPNGAGKTTTLRMVYGVARPSAGAIRVFGIDVAERPREVRARLGVTLQENVLIEALSSEENLRIFGRYHLLGEQAITGRIEWLLDFLELHSHARMPVATLSGGFKRRLAIAMSLMNDPELLILDEPTTGLDPAVRLALWSRIRALREDGTTVLLTTHYMDEAERLCDRVAIMCEGRIVVEGAPRSLIEERLGREAVELDCEPVEEQGLLDGLPRTLRRMRAGNRLMLYADDVTPVVERVHAADGGDRRFLIQRPANLEDVFLSLTGTQLLEGP